MSDVAELTAQDVADIVALKDRHILREMFIDYFSGGIRRRGFESFFADEFELDINGMVTHTHDETRALYAKVVADKPRLTGTFRMILSNFVIDVQGSDATVQFLWTQTLNDTIKGPPRFIEQGREFDRLRKIDGEWKITKRVVIADSGLPDLFDETFELRLDYSIADL